MLLSKFAKTGTAAPAGRPAGSKFGAAPAARPAAAASKFGARQAPEPEPEPGPEEDPEPEQQAPQRGGNRFGRTDSAPAGHGGRAQGNQRGGRARVPQRGRFTGTRSEAPKPPFLESGKHICKVVKTYESYKPGRGPRFNIQLEIIESSDPINKPGDIRSVGYNTDDAAFSATAGDVFAFVRAAAGFATDEDFLATFVNDSDQDLIDAAHGNPEAMKEIGPNGQPYGENPLEGCIIEAFGSRGNVSEKTGTQFYNFQWSPAEAF